MGCERSHDACKRRSVHSVQQKIKMSVSNTSTPCSILSHSIHPITFVGDADAGVKPTQLDFVADSVITAAGGFDHCAIVQEGGKLSIVGPQFRPADGSLLMSIALPAPATAVSAGEHHTLILTALGDVLALGSNREGQLGVSSIPTESNAEAVHVLGPTSGSEPIIAIAAGARHSLAITASGQLFSWGCSLHGQCGTGVIAPKISTPTLVAALGPLKVVSVGAGLSHSLCLTDSGDVYAWGVNLEGQLGDGSTTGSLSPKLVESLGAGDDPVVKISAGGRHSVALCASGATFSFGFGCFGQLGNGVAESVALPQSVDVGGAGNKVVDVAAGWWHTTLVVCSTAV